MKIQAYPVPEQAKTRTLPRHFGQQMLIVELSVYMRMSKFASSYAGGSWRFFELSNGGFYMSPPDDEYEIGIDSNGFLGRMSGDAAGIAVCLITFSDLSHNHSAKKFTEHFHWLRDFAFEHAEFETILQAID